MQQIRFQIKNHDDQFYKKLRGRVEAYLATGDYTDKAGAYAIQHIGSLLEHIEGSEDTILGLPTTLLKDIFNKNFL